MNTFTIQDILVFMVIVFVLLLIVFFFAGKRSSKPGGSKQIDEFNHAEKRSRGKIISASSTAISPELEMGTNEQPRYGKKEYFFSFQERKFFESLRESVGDNYQIFAHVRIADVLFLANEPKERKYWNNNIRCRHFDYLLCEPSQQRPIIAIELDDSSHKRVDRKPSDEFKNMACQTAGLPLLRIKLQKEYSHEKLSALIQAQIEKS